MIKINEEQKLILEKYKIKVENYEDINNLLDEINDVMISFVDEHDEPLPEFLELEKVYDEIYDLNI